MGEVKRYKITLDGKAAGEVIEPQITLHNVSAGDHVATVQAEYASGLSEIATRNFTVALAGDINGDGSVDASDVTALINKILGTVNFSSTLCDVNADGEVNVTDVTTLINMILE